ncbi:MAG TPA: hypothetical protein GXX46_08915 [Peptococcaceae bacterium]|nr:hypothetical protein [Peptococcaceae bacterium]
MFKKSLLYLIASALMFLLLGGCANSPGASAGKIIPPALQHCPLEGKWEVIEELGNDVHKEEPTPQGRGSNVQFTVDAAFFGSHVWDKPSYKIKRVNVAQYLLTKYVSLSDAFLPDNQEVEVVTVSTATNFLGEFMKVDETRMISFVQNQVFLLQKVADKADSFLKTAKEKVDGELEESNKGKSGILLGLKIPSSNGFAYQTYWVAADQQSLHPLLEVQGIFFPRKSGFWELKDVTTKAQQIQPVVVDTMGILALERQLSNEGIAGENRDKINAEAQLEPAAKSIMYVGNDYMAFEVESNGRRDLRILPVDKLSAPEGIKISDLFGDKGLEVYRGTREQVVRDLRQQGITWIDGDDTGENIGLMRKNGHWYLVGRVNYQIGDKFTYEDFRLNIIPPSNLIIYDTLTLSWRNIKDRVPDAVDAYTSPNKDIALIRTKNKIYVFAISGEHLAGKPLTVLELPEGTTVIMAEWSTGSYVDSWEKAFLAYGAVEK